ncbi:hypothetical protein EVAR_69305_1, partial [Eumeta japonica]
MLNLPTKECSAKNPQKRKALDMRWGYTRTTPNKQVEIGSWVAGDSDGGTVSETDGCEEKRINGGAAQGKPDRWRGDACRDDESPRYTRVYIQSIVECTRWQRVATLYNDFKLSSAARALFNLNSIANYFSTHHGPPSDAEVAARPFRKNACRKRSPVQFPTVCSGTCKPSDRRMSSEEGRLRRRSGRATPRGPPARLQRPPDAADGAAVLPHAEETRGDFHAKYNLMRKMLSTLKRPAA